MDIAFNTIQDGPIWALHGCGGPLSSDDNIFHWKSATFLYQEIQI